LVTVLPGPTVTMGVQVAQPPTCGPPDGSRARFQLMTVCAQFRGEPMIRFLACHLSVSENVLAGSADWLPEHSVK
jgi:hypothetical protein